MTAGESPATQSDALWNDPLHERVAQGVLLSDCIREYARLMGLIDTVDGSPLNDHLEPASYTLRAGNRYYTDGMTHTLGEGETITIPPNGLVYVRVMERLRLPYYLIARINLRVKQVYRGLLLGTGPQVDPGFEGFLSCPIHNLTDSPIVLRYGEPLATIDFEKTTPFTVARPYTSEQDLFDDPPLGIDDAPLKLWGASPKHRPLTEDDSIERMLPHGQTVSSGLSDLTRRLEKMEGIEREIRRTVDAESEKLRTEIREMENFARRMRIVGAAGLAAAVVMVAGWVWDIQGRLAEFVGPDDARVQLLERRVEAQEAELARLREAIRRDLTTPTAAPEGTPRNVP